MILIPGTLATPCPDAPSGYTYINGKYYSYQVSNIVPFLTAANDCKASGGARIATMKTQEEYNQVWLGGLAGKLCTLPQFVQDIIAFVFKFYTLFTHSLAA